MTAGTVIEALSDPTRRQVVTLLSGGPKRAGELAAAVGMSAPAMSRHLRVLLSAAVITDERLDDDARARVFRLRPESVKTVQAWLDSVLSGLAKLHADSGAELHAPVGSKADTTAGSCRKLHAVMRVSRLICHFYMSSCGCQ